jgi:predicted SnoaL-like aldol condensation-catalyzing enzyme
METVIHEMYAAFNSRDLDAAEAKFASGFYSHPLGTTGREHIRRAWAAMLERFPDLRITLDRALVSGDRAAIWATIHPGPDQPTANLVEIMRFADGRIAELWGLSDLAWRSQP